MTDSLGRDPATLLQALDFTATNGPDTLLRSATAALSNATHPRGAYPLTGRRVIDRTNAALAGGDSTQSDALRTTLDGYNALGSDPDQDGYTNGPQDAAGAPAPGSGPVGRLTEEQLVATREAEGWTGAEVGAIQPPDLLLKGKNRHVLFPLPVKPERSFFLRPAVVLCSPSRATSPAGSTIDHFRQHRLPQPLPRFSPESRNANLGV